MSVQQEVDFTSSEEGSLDEEQFWQQETTGSCSDMVISER